MGEPLSRSLAEAPVEEEALTPETAADLDCARASLARGESIAHAELLCGFEVRAKKSAADGRW